MSEPEASAPVPVDLQQREVARSAWTFGLLAACLSMMGSCNGGVSHLVALPLGIFAMTRARAVLQSGVPLDEATELYAKTGRLTGLMAAVVSGLLLTLLAAVVLFEFSMIAMMFGAASLAPTLPPPVPVP